VFQVALAASMVLISSGRQPEVHDDLVPCTGVFSWVEAPMPYFLAVRKALIGEHAYRKCQIVAIPSFHREWGVYLLRDERATDPTPTVVLKRLKASLWHEMSRELSENSIDRSISTRDEEQAAAIRRLSVEVDQFTVPVSEETADLLESVWEGMLDRVRYPQEKRSGNDGTTYYVAHFRPGSYRSGETWSPEEGTRTAALVQIGNAMAALAEAAPPERHAREGDVVAAALSLKERLEGLRNDPRER